MSEFFSFIYLMLFIVSLLFVPHAPLLQNINFVTSRVRAQSLIEEEELEDEREPVTTEDLDVI